MGKYSQGDSMYRASKKPRYLVVLAMFGLLIPLSLFNNCSKMESSGGSAKDSSSTGELSESPPPSPGPSQPQQPQQPQQPAPQPLPPPQPGEQAAGPNCGMQTNTAPLAYCDSFDQAFPIVGGSGQMDQRLWGVSRGHLGLNLGRPWPWPNATSRVCGGIASTTYKTDIQVCNGRMYDTINDTDEVTGLTMYPKQPFDFSGRVGTVAFDVTNDSTGTHSAWPEFWLTDQAFPVPQTHFSSVPSPANGFGIRFAGAVQAGQFGICPNGDNINFPRFTVDSAVVVRDWFQEALGEDCSFANTTPKTCVTGNMKLRVVDCVISSTGPTGGLNHIELKVSQNRIDIYATDAGKRSPLKLIAVLENANLPLSRGFIWIQDKHYNASKGPPGFSDGVYQTNHTFGWDNVAFDGPIIARDVAVEVQPAMVPISGGYLLGYSSLPGQGKVMKTLSIGPADIVAAKTATLLFTMYNQSITAKTSFIYKINGFVHQAAWPFPDRTSFVTRTVALPVPLTDLKMGENEIEISLSDAHVEIGNASISLNGAAGIVAP